MKSLEVASPDVASGNAPVEGAKRPFLSRPAAVDIGACRRVGLRRSPRIIGMAL